MFSRRPPVVPTPERVGDPVLRIQKAVTVKTKPCIICERHHWYKPEENEPATCTFCRRQHPECCRPTTATTQTLTAEGPSPTDLRSGRERWAALWSENRNWKSAAAVGGVMALQELAVTSPLFVLLIAAGILWACVSSLSRRTQLLVPRHRRRAWITAGVVVPLVFVGLAGQAYEEDSSDSDYVPSRGSFGRSAPYGGGDSNSPSSPSSYTPPSYTPPSYTPRPSPAENGSYYGEKNDAGYPKNQYVDGYRRSDGSYTRGYWRNSPDDGLGGG